MEDKNLNTVSDRFTPGGTQSANLAVVAAPDDTGALSLDPTSLDAPVAVSEAAKRPRNILRLLKRVDVLLVLLLVCILLGVLITNALHKKGTPKANASQDYGTVTIPLQGFKATVLNGDKFDSRSVVINGSLGVKGGLVVAPSVQPSAPTKGQLYYDQNTNQLAYYNGSGYVALTAQGATVQSLGGSTGAITLGGGLNIVGNQLSVVFPQQVTPTPASNPGVTSLGGLTGAITLGAGLISTGNGIQNAGVVSLSAGTPNLVVANDGNGNLTISNVGGGSGTVTSNGGTAGTFAVFNGVQDIEDSMLSQTGTTINAGGDLAVAGSLSVTGSVALSSALTVGNGGTGTGILPNNGVIVGQGSGPLTGVTAASAGLCLISTAGAPVFQACPTGNGVATLNGLTGALTIANATGSVNTITIDDASATTKGIASFNGTNFSVTNGAVNTVQDIAAGSTPTFAGVDTNTITPNATLNIGANGQSLNLLGSLVTVSGTANLVVQGGTATLGTLSQAGTLDLSDGNGHKVSLVTSSLTADRTYTLPDAGGTAALCVDSGNCIGGSGGAPNTADYLVANLNGTLTNERALAGGANITLADGGANANMTVATVMNPTFTTSVTTPVLQSSGALTISSAAGQTIAIDAGTTIELQSNTNVTGDLDVSAAFTAGTGNAFQVSSAGAITAATGLHSSGTIVFSGLDCSAFANGGTLTADASGTVTCSDDDGGSGSAISGSGTSGTVALFDGTNSITNSIITQTGTSVTIAGDLTLNTDLTVANGGTGAGSFTTHGVLFGNGTGALGVTTAGTGGQVLIADASGVPTFASFTGDVAVSNTGVTTIQANSVTLGADTTGNYIANLGTLTGLTATGNSGEGSTPTLSVDYGAIAGSAVQGNVTITCPSGTGNLSGGGTSITLGSGGSCGSLDTTASPTFTTSVTTPNLTLTGTGNAGSIQVGNLGQNTVYTLPDPGAAAATICISTGNCSTAGAAGGDLTGSYPSPTIAKLQGTNLTINSPAGGNILVYNATNSQWQNVGISGDVIINENGAATIQANSVTLGADTTGNYVLGLTAGNGVNVAGAAGEGWSPTISVAYGSSANTAVQGNTGITVTAGTNLSGGGAITLGAGGTLTLDVANSPTFSGTLAVQGASATIGTSSQQGSVILNDGSSNTGTVQTAALGQNTTFTLPDPGAGSATICLSTGNCAGSGGGVTTGGGTTNRVSKFTGGQALGDSSISDDGSTVTINGTANFVVQGGTATVGTLTQAGTLAVSDGSSNKVSIVASALAADRVYTLPDAGGPAEFCLSTGNCVGSGSGGSAPSDAAYLVTTLNGNLSNERAVTNGTNIAITDGGANGNFTVATVNNPTFSTSVTTPVLQSSGALTISSAAGQVVAIDAGTTIELQDSTNVTGSLDVSASFTAGTANAFQVSSAGAITAATGLATSGSVQFSGLNCTTFANGGALTTDASGNVTCSDDDGGAGGAITGSGTIGTIAIFNGTSSIANSIVTQSGTTVTIAGDLTLNTQLSVANGGTGLQAITSHGLLYGNGTAALGVTAAGTSGQVLVANASGIPTFVGFSGDVAVSNTGVTTIQANSVALGADTTGNYVANLGTLTGLSTSGNTGEGSTPTLSVAYGSSANTAVQGNVTLTCAGGTGNLSGGGTSITLGAGGSCGSISISNSPTFTTSVTTPLVVLSGAGSDGSVQVANLGQATAYTLPDPGAATANICLDTGNCAAAGTAGGDLTGSYPNPTIAKLQGTTVSVTSLASGNILQYNGTNWVNVGISGDVTLSSTGVATIQPSSVNSSKIADGTIVNNDLASGSFTNITGVGTLGGLTVVGTANLNTTGTAATSIGNSTGAFQLTSNGGLNVSTAGALTGVSGITTSGGYVQSGTTANTLTGATTLSAAGTALSVTNDASIGGTLTTNNITPNGALTVGTSGQSLTLQGSGTSTFKATSGTFTTTLAFVTPTANTTISLPALGAGTSYTLCTSAGNCAGVGATLQTAYNFSANPEIVLNSTNGALTVRDASTPLGANLLEVQNFAGTTTYFAVTSSGTSTTGASTVSGNINSTGGTIQTNSVDRIDNAGNLVNIGTITTSGNINSQTISSAANFTGTLAVQGANALTLGTANGNTGAILFKGQSNGNTLTLAGPASPGNFTLSLPAITANATVCTTNSVCNGYQASGNYLLQAPTTTAANTITPTTSGVVGLTVNGTSGATSAAAALFVQGNSTSPADTVQISTTATGGTQTNALLVNRNGAGGTTTNGINIQNAAGTLTNGLAFTGTIGTDITRSSGTLTIQGTGTTAVGSISTSTASSTLHIADTTSATGTQTITIGSTANTANSTTVQGNTITLQTNSSTGSVLVKAATDSPSAFQVQDAGGTSMFNVNTQSNVISVNNGTGSALSSFSALSSTLPANTSFAGSCVANGYLFVIGGHGASSTTATASAPIKSDGTLGAFTAQTPLPDPRDYTVESVACYNNYVYVVAGTDTGNNSDYEWGTYVSHVTSGGGLTAWVDTGVDVAIPTSRYGVSTVVANGYMYGIGGVYNNGGTQAVSNLVTFTKLRSDGMLSSWNVASANLPAGTSFAHMSIAYVNGKIFLMGGANASGTSQTQVYYGTPDPSTGDIPSWTQVTNSLPAATSNSTAIAYNGYMYIINGGNNAMYVSQISTTGQPLGAWSTVSLSPMTSLAGRFSAMYNGYFYVMGGGPTGSTTVYSASAARTQLKGSLDLIGSSDGIVGGEGVVGGTLTSGNTSVVGTLNVQGNANFSQGASVTDNLSVVSSGEGHAGLSIISDLDNDPSELGGSYITMAVDGNLTRGIVGVTNTSGFGPDGTYAVTGALANAMMVGSSQGNGTTQFITANYDSASSQTLSTQVRMTIMAGTQSSTATHVCINVTSCTKTLGVSGTIGATGAINGSGSFNTTGGADLAEYIHASKDVQVADVVMADPDNTERVVKTTGAYSGAAVGVISDPDKAGFVSNVYGDIDGNTTDPDAKPLTLAGRVYVKVTNENGAIKPGDYLTSSSTPGMAMKATHAGPTIGKALGSFNGTTGTVLVLVNLSYYSPGNDIQGDADGSFSNLNATGNVIFDGNLTVNGLTTVKDIKVGGHIITAGNTPTAEIQAAAGAGASVIISGTDTAGTITITAGTGATSDDLAKVIFSTAYGKAPEVVLTPVGKVSAKLQAYVDGATAASFMLGAGGDAPAAGQTYTFNYHTLQ